MNANAFNQEPVKIQVGTHKSAQDGTGELRTKIIQLLSSTANGCLSELGYFPGMPEQFQQILQTNAALQNDNAKLFEDNRALARVVAMQNDRLAFLAGEDDVKLKQLAEMRDKIESLSMEQAKLKQTNEMLQATPVAQRYRQLFAESQMLRIKNDALERDFIRLRDSYSALHNTAAEKGTLPSGQVAPGPLVQQIRRITAMPNVSANRNQRRASDTQAQMASQHPYTNNQEQHRRGSSERVPQMAAWHAPAQNHTIHQAGPIQQQPQRRLSEGYSRDPQAIEPIANRPDPSVPHIAQVHPVHPDNGLSPLTSGPPVPSSSDLNASSAPPQSLMNNTANPLTPLTIDARNLPITPISPNHLGQDPSQSVQGWSPPLTPSINPPQAAEVIDLTADDDVSAQVPIAADVSDSTAISREKNVHSPAPSIEEPLYLRRSSGDMAGLQPATSRDEPVALNSPASSVEEPLMKRSISDMESAQQQGTSANQPRKRSRLNDSHEDDTVPQVEPPSAMDEDTGPDHEGTADENGLLAVEDCVAAVFTEDEEKEGEQVCNLCVLRYERGAIEDPPLPFVRPPLDVLVAHCIDEHPIVWEKLRHSTSQD